MSRLGVRDWTMIVTGFHLSIRVSFIITSEPTSSVPHLKQMESDDEMDPLALNHSLSHQHLQSLLFPRSRSIFMPLTSPSTIRRNSSFRYSFGSRHEYQRHRSQALLERNSAPAHSWENFRKSDDELRAMKKKKVRQFYERQVRLSHVSSLC